MVMTTLQKILSSLIDETIELKDRISVLEKQVDVRDEQIIQLFEFKKAVEKILEDA